MANAGGGITCTMFAQVGYIASLKLLLMPIHAKSN